MQKHVMIVFSNPIEGKDKEYNDWYNKTHLSEVLEFPGFVAGQRFTVNSELSGPNAPAQKYVAIYELETDDLEGALGRLREANAAGKTDTSGPISVDNLSSSVFSAISERLESPS